MTKKEKIIVSAYTGVLMCDFSDVHEYIQKKFGRLVFTHELADRGVQKEVKEKSKEEFLEICEREEPECKKGEWIPDDCDYERRYICSECKLPFRVETFMMKPAWRFCPNCGCRMEGESE